VRIFSARACAAPLEDAARLFEQRTGLQVAISACSRHCARPVAEEAVGRPGGHDFLDEVAEGGVHDLAISGAEYLLDDGEVRGTGVGLTAFARQPEAAKQFMEFLTTPEARRCYERYGWAAGPTRMCGTAALGCGSQARAPVPHEL
jgi:hypothetical protein